MRKCEFDVIAFSILFAIGCLASAICIHSDDSLWKIVVIDVVTIYSGYRVLTARDKLKD